MGQDSSLEWRRSAGFTLVEMLCVFAIIMVLTTLFLGPASRILQRVRNDKWAEDATELLRSSVTQLNQHFQGLQAFPTVTLESIEAQALVRPAELRFLKDRRVTFLPFAGSDSDSNTVIFVVLKRGFFTDPGYLSERKQAITRVPD